MKTNKKYYEVWALGFDKEDMCTDIEELLFESTDPNEAIAFAKSKTKISDIFDVAARRYLEPGDYLQITVETLLYGDMTNTNQETLYESFIKD